MPTPTQASLVVHKQFDYRGSTQAWSNRYWLDTDIPDLTTFEQLADLVVAAEAPCLRSDSTIVGVTGYKAGSAVANWTKTFATAGSASISGSHYTTGDSAALVRYSTTARTSKGHPIYLFNYYHSVMSTTSGTDALLASQKTALETYASAWIAGFSPAAGGTYKRSGPRGAVAQARTVSPWIHHRDFPA